MPKFKPAFFLFVLIGSQTLFASEQRATDKITEVQKTIEASGKKYGVPNVLVVFDNDNTLMASTIDLGSDAWYQWQKDLIKKDDKTDSRVAKTPDELYRWGELLSPLIQSRTTEKNTVEVVKKIQKAGFKTIILTARDSFVRDATEKAFQTVGLEFASSQVGEGFPGTFIPKNLEKAKPISYMNGIVMVSGQHKGETLKALLEKLGVTFKAIIFSDDKKRNVDAVYETFSPTAVDVTTFLFTAEDKNVSEFEKKDKTQVTQDYFKFKSVLDSVFRGPNLRANP